jgi:hypothetical protein
MIKPLGFWGFGEQYVTERKRIGIKTITYCYFFELNKNVRNDLVDTIFIVIDWLVIILKILNFL